MSRAAAIVFGVLAAIAAGYAVVVDRRESARWLGERAAGVPRQAVSRFDTAPHVSSRLKACRRDDDCVVVAEKSCCDLLHAAVNREGAAVFARRDPPPPCSTPCGAPKPVSYQAKCLSDGACWLVE